MRMDISYALITCVNIVISQILGFRAKRDETSLGFSSHNYDFIKLMFDSTFRLVTAYMRTPLLHICSNILQTFIFDILCIKFFFSWSTFSFAF